jgi:hypothetical protein
MRVQLTNIFHLLIFNILKIYVSNVNKIWFTAQYHLLVAHLWAAAHRLGTTGIIDLDELNTKTLANTMITGI